MSDPRKVLIAVDASENSRRAVQYAGEILGCSKGLCTVGVTIELLSISRPPQRDIFPDRKSWEKRSREQEQQALQFLAQARGMLEEAGIEPEAIKERHMCIMEPSIARNILNVQEEGDFGTVIVGRRGMSKAEEFLLGSVSNKIVHYAKDCTVWVVQ